MLLRSYKFLEAVSEGNWRGTFQNDPIPAITTYWLGALGILSYYASDTGQGESGILTREKTLPEVYKPSLQMFAHARYPGILLTSLTIGALYLILRQVLGRQTAWLSAAFLAFDPYYTAMSRVLGYHALHATFAIMSVACLCLGLHKRQTRWLALCGFFVGLALLSVSIASALLVVIFMSCVADHVLKPNDGTDRRWKRLLRDLMIIYGMTALTVFALWPSMWVQPLEAIRSVVEEALYYSHIGVTFFWGGVRPDPGVFFYPVILLFRSTPIVLFGAAITFGALGSRLVRSKCGERDTQNLCLNILWISFLGYFAALSVVAAKADRFMLPGFVVLDVLAGIGWSLILPEALLKWLKLPNKRFLLYGALVTCGLQIITCLPYHPYYFSYYNPVMGGANVAVKVIPVGWGEGLEQAANYLNRKNDSENLRVAVLYPQLFKNFFKGKVHGRKFPPTTEGRHRHWPAELDYAVVYIAGLQRFKLPRSFTEIFRKEDAEFVAQQNGIEYAWVYNISSDKFKAIPDSVTPWLAQYGIGLNLVGYKAYSLDLDKLTGNYSLPIVLFWQFEESCAKEHYFDYELIDNTGRIWASKQTLPYCADWERIDNNGLIFPEDLSLEIESAIPSGVYHLEISQRRIPDGEVTPIVRGIPVLPITLTAPQ